MPPGVEEEMKKDSVKELNNRTFIFVNKLYPYARLTKLETGEREMDTTEKKITPNSFWRLEEDEKNLGYFYIYNAPLESGYRIGKFGQGDRDIGIQYGNYSDDQLWKFVDCGDGFCRIYNKHKGARIAKWGKNDTEWGTCSGKLEDSQLWKLIPRYKARIETALVWECDNVMGSRDFSENVSVTVGLKVTNSETLTFTSGLQYSLLSSIAAATKSAENIANEKLDAIVDAVSRYKSFTGNRPWSKTKDVIFTAPAGSKYRVFQLICDFQSPLGIDDLSVGCHYTMEETNNPKAPVKRETSERRFSLMDQSFI